MSKLSERTKSEVLAAEILLTNQHKAMLIMSSLLYHNIELLEVIAKCPDQSLIEKLKRLRGPERSFPEIVNGIGNILIYAQQENKTHNITIN